MDDAPPLPAGPGRKAADAFRTISEAATELDLPQHVLRHWEDTFGAIRPMRRAGGRRYYRTYDVELLAGIRVFLHDHRITTRGVQKIFAERGAAYVAEIGRAARSGARLPSLMDADTEAAADRVPPRAIAALTARPSAVRDDLLALKQQIAQLRVQLSRVQAAPARS